MNPIDSLSQDKCLILMYSIENIGENVLHHYVKNLF